MIRFVRLPEWDDDDGLKDIHMSSALKIVVGIVPILSIVCFFWYMECQSRKMDARFYRGRFSTVVTKISNWQGRSIDYYLQNGFRINIVKGPDADIEVGDSIHKEENTYLYYVYRKNSLSNVYGEAVIHNYRK